MRILLALACLLGAALAPADPAFGSAPDLVPAAQAIAEPVFADPPRDAAHPAINRQLLVPSHGEQMNALFLLAAGEGPHPTLLLLHGLPGNEQNLDLAQAVRRAGWNVLTLHYRGSWGSPGRFAIAGAIEDAAAALDYLHRPEILREYRIDPSRIVAGGHSMGGLAVTIAGTVDRAPALAGILLIDPWNAGADGRELAAATPAQRGEAEAGFDDLGHSLAGATAASLVAELVAHHRDWDMMTRVPGLAARPLLLVTAVHGGGPGLRPMVAALRVAGADRVTAVEMETDHSFADHRIALAAETVRWLRELP